jgi:3-deoxy-D-manno-octulosonic-acid transferase
MSIYLRNAVYLTFLVGLLPWLVWRWLRTGRYRAGLSQKLWGCSQLPAKPAGVTRVWLHGVSVGEIQLLAALIEQLRAKLARVEFVISTTTDTGLELSQKLYGPCSDCRIISFPMDFSWAVRRTISALNSDLLVLGELEVWPNLLALAKQAGLPVAVVNGRLSPASFRGYQRLRWLTQGMFEQLSLVVAQTQEYAQRFIQCGVPVERVVVGGSFKFDNVSFDRNCAEVSKLASLVGLQAEHQVWVVGSSQDPEECVACSAFKKAQQIHPQLKLIVVPRHRERFDSVFELLQTQGVRVLRRSRIEQPVPADQWDVLLVDTIGELRWWWGTAHLALVGGSFGSRNGQNMLEPAGYGACVAFGPRTLNFRAIVELLLGAKAAQQINSLEHIEAWLMGELNNPQHGQAQGQRAQQLIRLHQGAIDRTARELLALVTVQPAVTRSQAA